MVTINPATYFRFEDRGALTPGRLADIAIISDLYQMTVEALFIGGELVAHQGKLVVDLPSYTYPDTVKNSVKRPPVNTTDLEIHSEKTQVTANCIVVIPDQNLTETLKVTLPVKRGVVTCNLKEDVIYMACLERYGKGGKIGKCFVKGFGLKQGAIAKALLMTPITSWLSVHH